MSKLRPPGNPCLSPTVWTSLPGGFLLSGAAFLHLSLCPRARKNACPSAGRARLPRGAGAWTCARSPETRVGGSSRPTGGQGAGAAVARRITKLDLGQGGRNQDLRVAGQVSGARVRGLQPSSKPRLCCARLPGPAGAGRAAGRAAAGGRREWAPHVTGKSDRRRGPGSGNRFTVYSETGIFLIHQGRLPSRFLDQTAPSQPGRAGLGRQGEHAFPVASSLAGCVCRHWLLYPIITFSHFLI